MAFEGQAKKVKKKKLKLRSKKNLWKIWKSRKILKKLTYNCPRRPNQVNDHTDVEIQNMLKKKVLLRITLPGEEFFWIQYLYPEKSVGILEWRSRQ